jgi:probable biosynthetic protein (TIGR04098 family)
MPQMAANGLSENWLFRECGALHWQELCSSLGCSSGELRDERGDRLYPTFVAVSGRYSAPLAAVRENDELDLGIDLRHYGQSFFHSQVTLGSKDSRYELEMLTAFAARESQLRNELRKSVPASKHAYTTRALPEAPPLLVLSREVRRRETPHHRFCGKSFDLSASLDLSEDYEPSPYFDFNGANLLYFASYPCIADTLERRMIRNSSLWIDQRDWAIATSTIARDVFYHRNLDVGELVRATLRTFVREGELIRLHTTLHRGSDQTLIADVFTAKVVLPPTTAS